jgi:3-oxoacyl-[acyl-carrier protein] reductase
LSSANRCEERNVDLGVLDRVYLVMGGSGGLGYATAKQLVAEGARVVISGRTSSGTTRSAKTLGGVDRAIGVAGDNSDPATAPMLVDTAMHRFGRLDGALISVGGPPPGAVMDVDDQQWRGSFEAVFLGAIRIARTVAKAAEEDASLAFVLSSSVRAPLPGMAISNGLRPGLGMVAKALSDELGPRGIRVNGLMPAWLATSRAVELSAAGHDKPRNSLGRRGSPGGVRTRGDLPALAGSELHDRRDDRRRRRCATHDLSVVHEVSISMTGEEAVRR